MGASSVSGVGNGSADKKGSRANEHLFVGIERLIGTRIVFSGKTTLSGGTRAIVFPKALSGVAADYIVLSGGSANHSYASDVTVDGFTMNGTGTETVSYIVVRISYATVEV